MSGAGTMESFAPKTARKRSATLLGCHGAGTGASTSNRPPPRAAERGGFSGRDTPMELLREGEGDGRPAERGAFAGGDQASVRAEARVHLPRDGGSRRG